MEGDLRAVNVRFEQSLTCGGEDHRKLSKKNRDSIQLLSSRGLGKNLSIVLSFYLTSLQHHHHHLARHSMLLFSWKRLQSVTKGKGKVAVDCCKFWYKYVVSGRQFVVFVDIQNSQWRQQERLG